MFCHFFTIKTFFIFFFVCSFIFSTVLTQFSLFNFLIFHSHQVLAQFCSFLVLSIFNALKKIVTLNFRKKKNILTLKIQLEKKKERNTKTNFLVNFIIDVTRFQVFFFVFNSFGNNFFCGKKYDRNFEKNLRIDQVIFYIFFFTRNKKQKILLCTENMEKLPKKKTNPG